jgi:hypothetical protein
MRQIRELTEQVNEISEKGVDVEFVVLGLEDDVGDVLGVVGRELEVLGDRPVADERERGIEPQRTHEVGVLVGGEDEPKEEHEDLVRLALAVERPLGEVGIAVLERLDGLVAHRRPGRFEALEQVVEREVLGVDRAPDGDAVRGLLDDAQPHQLRLGVVHRVDLGRVEGISLLDLDVDDAPAEDVLGDDGPLDRRRVQFAGVDDGLGLLLLDGLRENRQRPLATDTQRHLVPLLDAVFAGPLRRQRHRQRRRPQSLDFPRFHALRTTPVGLNLDSMSLMTGADSSPTMGVVIRDRPTGGRSDDLDEAPLDAADADLGPAAEFLVERRIAGIDAKDAHVVEFAA